MEGAKSALPIWTEFMKRAHQHREYRNVHGWDAPDGIVSVDIDPLSGQLATAGCGGARSEVFVSGTQPVELCRLHGGGGTQVAGWETVPAPAPVKPGQQSQPAAGPATRFAPRGPCLSVHRYRLRLLLPRSPSAKTSKRRAYWGASNRFFNNLRGDRNIPSRCAVKAVII